MSSEIISETSTTPRVTIAYADEALHIKRLAPLSDADIARATGAGVSTVHAWVKRTRAPRGERAHRLVELSALVERLANVLDPDYVPVWLNKPMSALDDDKPIERIARGEYRSVSRIVAELESPTY